MSTKPVNGLSDLFQHMKNTGQDLTTLEINTIIKPEMMATTPPGSNRLALYELARSYSECLEKLGSEYLQLAVSSGVPVDAGPDVNLFRKQKLFEGGGVFSFRELGLWAYYSAVWLRSHATVLKTDAQILEDNLRILARIEVKSLEISRILEITFEKPDSIWVNPLDSDKAQVSDADEDMIMKVDPQSALPPKLQTLFNRYTVLRGMKVSILDESREGFLKDVREIPLDLKHKMVVHKSLDLGTEHIVMQTRISLDGDITTRISQRFADQPIQFVLETHHASVGMAVNYWSKIFDALIDFVAKIWTKIGS